ncbi:unnamed protein product [Linum tenue]|uniref:HMA domain-containing protein n=1 Tax=Linum tenue TaxID=586396 RepID=A0AAV0I5D3_9ROSI|nr:unnamed protein product [Linum tenue]
MGILDHFSELCDSGPSHDSKKLKRKQLQTVEIRVKIDCEGCERKVRRSVEGMKGVTQVLNRVRHRTGKKADLWPYVPYDVVDHPYAPGSYDKKAPPGYVRNVMYDPHASALARATSFEVKTTTAFSDENPNACSVM